MWRRDVEAVFGGNEKGTRRKAKTMADRVSTNLGFTSGTRRTIDSSGVSFTRERYLAGFSFLPTSHVLELSRLYDYTPKQRREHFAVTAESLQTFVSPTMASAAAAVDGSNIDLEAQVSHSTAVELDIGLEPLQHLSLGNDDESPPLSASSTLIPSTNASNASTETFTPSIAPSVIVQPPKAKCKVLSALSPITVLPPGGSARPSFTKCNPFWAIALYLLAILFVIGWMVVALVLILAGCKGGDGGGLKIGFGVGMLCVGFLPAMGLYGSLSVRWEKRGVGRAEARLVRDREVRGRGEW